MRLHNRQIKAGFWNDPDLLEWPREQRWLYAGLIQLADDSGCLEYREFAFKLHLFPSPVDADITVELLEQWTAELVAAGKAVDYYAGGKRCLFLTRFHDHQHLTNPAAPEVPLPAWITWHPSENPRRGGCYVVGQWQAVTAQESPSAVTVTELSQRSDQPEQEQEQEILPTDTGCKSTPGAEGAGAAADGLGGAAPASFQTVHAGDDGAGGSAPADGQASCLPGSSPSRWPLVDQAGVVMAAYLRRPLVSPVTRGEVVLAVEEALAALQEACTAAGLDYAGLLREQLTTVAVVRAFEVGDPLATLQRTVRGLTTEVQGGTFGGSGSGGGDGDQLPSYDGRAARQRGRSGGSAAGVLGAGAGKAGGHRGGQYNV